MAHSNAKWQGLPEKYKWLVRIAMFLLALGNGWEWYEHMAAHNPIVALIDALFVALCVWFLYKSF
jgi:hypothetical protein